MVKRIGSRRRKTRSKFSKNPKLRGKVPIRRFITRFNTGDKVVLAAEPSVPKGIYFPRFHGMIGTVSGMRGKSYCVEINDRGKKKRLLVKPVHLKRKIK